MTRFGLFIILVFSFAIIWAQDNDSEYTKVLTQRSEKIVDVLNLTDKSVYNKVVGAVVDQYKNVGRINDRAEDAKKQTKQITDKTAKELKVTVIENERNADLYNQYCMFIGNLSPYLDEKQITAVKDGLTYGVVKVTYDSYLDMIPSLKDFEKQQIYAWLVEAREHAVCASSSKDKHGWFGKYKGRINNYLSKQGYDVQAERKGWEERLKAQGKSL